MWIFASITTESGPKSSILFGSSTAGQEVIGPTGPLAGNYILAFPGLGYIKMIDKGNSVPGGDFSVAVSNAPSNWFYGGLGQARIVVKANGDYTITGGQKDASGKLVPF